MLVVVAAGEVGVDGAELHRHDREALALEAADDLADEAALDRVGLAEDEGAGAHGLGKLVGRAPSVHEHGRAGLTT